LLWLVLEVQVSHILLVVEERLVSILEIQGQQEAQIQLQKKHTEEMEVVVEDATILVSLVLAETGAYLEVVPVEVELHSTETTLVQEVLVETVS
jgi:hypothetical protein